MVVLQLSKDNTAGEVQYNEQTIFRGSQVVKGAYFDELGLIANETISASRRFAEIHASSVKRAEEGVALTNELGGQASERAKQAKNRVGMEMTSKRWAQKRANKERAKKGVQENVESLGHTQVSNSSLSSQSKEGDESCSDESPKKKQRRTEENA